MIKEGSDFFQNSKFYPSLNIYNYLDGQFFNFAWVANSTLSCTVSYKKNLFLQLWARSCLKKNQNKKNKADRHKSRARVSISHYAEKVKRVRRTDAVAFRVARTRL